MPHVTTASSKGVFSTVSLVTFGVFMTEAMFHYSMGKKSESPDKYKGQMLVLPPARDFFKLALVVGVFSVLNGIIIKEISQKV